MKKFTWQKAITLLGIILLISGTVLLISLMRSRELSRVAAPSFSASTVVAAKPSSPTALYGEPVQLQIPSLGINLPIIPGYYDHKTQEWTLTTDKVQYATITPEPNDQSGNTFLYGHARKNVFGSLHTIAPHAEAIVQTNNGHTFYYRLNGALTVDPTDSAAVLDYQGKPMLTIQTCTGLFWQNRQLFYFDLEKVV